MVLWINYTNETCGLFLHHHIRKLDDFWWYLLCGPCILYEENLCLLQLFRTPFICWKYTAILFPLVSYTNEMCGLSGAVLEISLSSFQVACLSWTCTMRSSRRVSSDAATQIFAKVSNFPSWQPKKKRSSLHFLNFESKQRPVNTVIQSAVYASWNVLAEKGRTHRRGKILSSFWKPQKPL